MPGGSYVGVGVPPEKCASPAHGEGPTKWEGLFKRNNAEPEICALIIDNNHDYFKNKDYICI